MIQQKDIDKLFKGMEAICATEIFFSELTHEELKKSLDEWFYRRSHNAKRYVWGEGGIGYWSYCCSHSEDDLKTLKITFVSYQL